MSDKYFYSTSSLMPFGLTEVMPFGLTEVVPLKASEKGKKNEKDRNRITAED